MLKQLSVFIENREGRICELAKILAENEINIITLSLADTADYGMVRMIVDDPDKAIKVLKAAEYSAMIVDVIGVCVKKQVGSFYQFVQLLVASDISVEYIYTLTCNSEPALVLKVSDPELSTKLLNEAGYELLEPEDIKEEFN